MRGSRGWFASVVGEESLDGVFKGLFEECWRELSDDRVCAAAKLGAILATIRPEQAGLPGPARKGSPRFLFFWVCVCVCREALSGEVEIV